MGALSLSPSDFLSLTHTFQSPLCEQSLFTLIYIHLHPFQPHWVRVHYCHPPQQSAPLNRGRHRWRVVVEGSERRVRTGSVVSSLIEGSCFWHRIYFKVKTIGIFTHHCLFKLSINIYNVLTSINTSSLCLLNQLLWSLLCDVHTGTCGSSLIFNLLTGIAQNKTLAVKEWKLSGLSRGWPWSKAQNEQRFILWGAFVTLDLDFHGRYKISMT